MSSKPLNHSTQVEINARKAAQAERRGNAEFLRDERQKDRQAKEASQDHARDQRDSMRASRSDAPLQKSGKKGAKGGFLKVPKIRIKRTNYGASVRVVVGGRQYQSALYDQRKGFNGGAGSVAHPVASESMFMRSESYGARKGARQNLDSGGTSKRRSTAGLVVSEVLRDLENTHHLDQQAILNNPHIVHHGDPQLFREALSGLEKDLGKTSEHFMVGFVFSLPKVSLVKDSNAEIWPGYRDDCIKFIKNRYPDRPCLIVEHRDEETNFHIHVLLLNNPGERLDQWYEPRKAVANATAGFRERIIQSKLKDGAFTGTLDEQRAQANTWANGAIKHGFLQTVTKEDGTTKKVRVYDKDLVRESTALKKSSFSAAASAMQDDFHAQVAAKYGKTRFGPRRQRLSAAEMQAQKAVQSMVSLALDRECERILATSRKMESTQAISQKLDRDVAQKHGERKIGKRKSKQQRQAAKKESKAHEAQIRAMTAEQSALAHTLEEMGQRRDTLAGELKDLSGDITKKTQQLERTREKVADLLKRGRNTAGQVRQQKAILNNLTRTVSDLEAERLVKSEALDALDADVAAKREQLAKAKGELNTTNTELKAVKAEVAQNEEFRIVLAEENEALARQTDQSRRDLEDIKADKERAQAERDDIQRTIETVRFGLQAAASASGMLGCRIAGMTAAKELLENDLAADQQALALLAEDKARVLLQLHESRTLLKRINENSDVLEATLAKLNKTATRIFGTTHVESIAGETVKRCEAIEKMITAADLVESVADIQADYKRKRDMHARQREAAVNAGDRARVAKADQSLEQLEQDHARRLAVAQAAGLDVVESFNLNFGTRHALREFAGQVCEAAKEGFARSSELDDARRKLEEAGRNDTQRLRFQEILLNIHKPQVDALTSEIVTLTRRQLVEKSGGRAFDAKVKADLHGHPALAGLDADVKGLVLRQATEDARALIRDEVADSRQSIAQKGQTFRAPRPS